MNRGARNMHAHKVLVENLEGNGPLGRPRHRWKDNKVDPEEIRWKIMDLMHLAQDVDQCWLLYTRS